MELELGDGEAASADGGAATACCDEAMLGQEVRVSGGHERFVVSKPLALLHFAVPARS